MFSVTLIQQSDENRSFLRHAELEMLDAARYYELQASGLGNDFLDKIDSAVQDIGSHPERWPVVRFNIRRRLVLHIAAVEFVVAARRQRCSCISIPQSVDNEADAEKSAALQGEQNRIFRKNDIMQSVV